MSSINGALAPTRQNTFGRSSMLRNLVSLIGEADIRGKNGWGIICNVESTELWSLKGHGRASKELTINNFTADFSWAINSNRAESIANFVKEKSLQDIQPFEYEGWAVAHNGTIVNGKELYKLFNLEPRTRIDSDVIPRILHARFGGSFIPENIIRFLECQLIGSYALAIGHKNYLNKLVLMCNYKPLYLALHREYGYVFFTSLESLLRTDTLHDAFYGEFITTQVKPYSSVILEAGGFSVAVTEIPFQKTAYKPKALIVCSGGLDSTVTATWAQQRGYDITLIHFLYKCRAESRERRAVEAIGKSLNCPVVYIDTDVFKNTIGSSRLTETLNEQEVKIEIAPEWVPARNLIMLSIATGYAEAKGFEVIMLGVNLEESGTHPDNETIFINKLNEVLPYATQVGRRVRIEMPVGNLMKHEIVKLGIEIGAPLGLCWSCYEAGDIHCGNCGSCSMRKAGFEINGLKDIIPYATDTHNLCDTCDAGGYDPECPSENLAFGSGLGNDNIVKCDGWREKS
ncbi:MAG: 7-cyano-7-deazaguanine synthase [Syntrophomonadaceae bacterium]|nr:7-cyano-7-deazaguanine synthase [Bacillota bacterium]